MKTLLTALTLIALSPNARAESANSAKFSCDLSDSVLFEKGQPDVVNQVFEVQDKKTATVATYGGKKYEIAYFINTGDSSAAPSYELSLDARDAKTNRVIASAIVTYSLDTPDAILQVGPNVLLRCVSSN